MHELTPSSIELVFEFLSGEPTPGRRTALLAWLPRLTSAPDTAAGYALADGTLFATVPRSDVDVWYRILETPNPAVSITRIS